MIVERELKITIEDQQPLAVLKLHGFMAQLEVYKLKSTVEQILAEASHFLVMDLSDVNFIDSAGLGSLTQIRNQCIHARGQMVLVQPRSPQVSQALEVSALSRIIECFPDLPAAIQYLRTTHGLPQPQAEVERESGKMEDLTLHLQQVDSRLQGIEQRLDQIAGMLQELAQAKPPKPAPVVYPANVDF